EEYDHECKPSPNRRTSASTSGQEAGQAARADCGGPGDGPCCARSKSPADLFSIPHENDREGAFSRRLACLKRMYASALMTMGRGSDPFAPIDGTAATCPYPGERVA